MTATVLDVIWCFDCAVRRDLIASTALSPARSCRFYAYLLQQPGTHLYRRIHSAERYPRCADAQRTRMLLMPRHDRRLVRYALARRTVLRLHQCATPRVLN